MTALEVKVAELTSIRCSAETGEQIRGGIQVHERAMAATGKVLGDLARLNLDERAVRVQEAQVALLAGALHQAIAETELSDETRQAIVVRVSKLVAEGTGSSSCRHGGCQPEPGSAIGENTWEPALAAAVFPQDCHRITRENVQRHQPERDPARRR
jgi:hypothetical protein